MTGHALTQLAVPLERLIGELAEAPRRRPQDRATVRVPRPESPGRGRRGALIVALRELRERIRPCAICFNLAESETLPDLRRPSRGNGRTVCVVEDAVNVLALERTNAFRGVYHVLGGALSPLKDIGPEDLKIRELVGARQQRRCARGDPRDQPERRGRSRPRSTSPDSSSRSTCRPRDWLRDFRAGADLEFTDDVTIQRALENRRDY